MWKPSVHLRMWPNPALRNFVQAYDMTLQIWTWQVRGYTNEELDLLHASNSWLLKGMNSLRIDTPVHSIGKYVCQRFDGLTHLFAALPLSMINIFHTFCSWGSFQFQIYCLSFEDYTWTKNRPRECLIASKQFERVDVNWGQTYETYRTKLRGQGRQRVQAVVGLQFYLRRFRRKSRQICFQSSSVGYRLQRTGIAEEAR